MSSPRTYLTVAAMLSAFLAPFMGSAVNLAIPAIGREMSLDAIKLNWLVTSYLIATAAFLLPFGRTADLYGRRFLFLIGNTGFALLSLASALSPNGNILLACRTLHGVVAAMIFSTNVALLTGIYPPQERGKILGYNTAVVYTGLSLGPVLGGYLTHQLGWRSVFFFTAILAFTAALLTLWKVKGEWRDDQGGKFDFNGAVLYSAAIACLMYSLAALNSSPYALWFLLAGAAAFTFFVKHGIQHPAPILRLSLFRHLTFAFSNLAALINYSATFAVTYLLSLYLQVIQGYDARFTGFILLAQPLLMATLSPLSGRLSDRIEPRFLASAGMGLTTLGLALFLFLDRTTPLSLVIANLVLIGTGFALFSSPNTNAVMSSVEKRFYGVAAATLSTMRMVGQALSMALVTLFFAAFLHGKNIEVVNSEPLLQSIKLSFAVFALLSLSGIFASLARGKIHQPAR